jgi:hypothetical protein
MLDDVQSLMLRSLKHNRYETRTAFTADTLVEEKVSMELAFKLRQAIVHKSYRYELGS